MSDFLSSCKRIIKLFLKDEPGLQGSVMLEHQRNGQTLQIVHRLFIIPIHRKGFHKNLITSAGKALIANLLIGQDTAPTHIAIGTGTTPPAAGDTTLEAEHARAAATRSRVTITATNDTAQYFYVFTLAVAVSIGEAGLLNAGTGGVLACRQQFTLIPCLVSDTLKVTWRLQA